MVSQFSSPLDFALGLLKFSSRMRKTGGDKHLTVATTKYNVLRHARVENLEPMTESIGLFGTARVLKKGAPEIQASWRNWEIE